MCLELLKATLSNMKNKIKLIANFINYVRVTFFDFKRYFVQAVNISNEDSLEGKIIKKTHSLEKRLSFENPEPSYGKSKVFQLIHLISKYEVKVKKNNRIVDWSVSVVYQMIENYFNEEEKYLFQQKTKNIGAFDNLNLDKSKGGYYTVEKKSITDTNFTSFKDLAFSRHSIRSFVGPVPEIYIEKAVEVALKSPSNCNLQPIRIYKINDKEKINNILQLQRGNKGFTSEIHQLIVFVVNLSNYSGFRERNQCFIDTGIFSVTFAYALHDLGYGSCMLNWASTVNEDRSINRILKLPKNHIVTLTMAIGDMPNKLKIPRSLRRKPKEIINTV